MLTHDQSTDVPRLLQSRDIGDGSQAHKFSGSWQSAVLKNDLRAQADQSEGTIKTNRFNYKGVQVMRNGDVSPQYSGDFNLANVASSAETLPEDPTKNSPGQRNLLSRQITQPLSLE